MQQALTDASVDYIKLSGVLDAENSSNLQRKMDVALSQSQGSLLVADMGDVESIDSDGLMVLVAILNQAQEQGKSFALKDVPAPVQIVLEVTKLDQVFDIVDSVIAPEPESPVAVAA